MSNQPTSPSESVTDGTPLDLEYHGDKADLVTASGAVVALRRNGQTIRLTVDGQVALVLTETEADFLAYNLACSALAAMAEPDEVRTDDTNG